MAEIFFLGILSALLFIGFITTLILGLVLKKRNLIISGVLCFMIFFITGGLTIYKTVTKVRAKVSEVCKPRSGEEIYDAVFGKPESDCVQILHYKDAALPRIDDVIWLHFKTCPEELTRNLEMYPFEKKKVSVLTMDIEQPTSYIPWVKPQLMGDSIYIYECSDKYTNGQTIYSNLDQTEAYCVDMFY